MCVRGLVQGGLGWVGFVQGCADGFLDVGCFRFACSRISFGFFDVLGFSGLGSASWSWLSDAGMYFWLSFSSLPILLPAWVFTLAVAGFA